MFAQTSRTLHSTGRHVVSSLRARPAGVLPVAIRALVVVLIVAGLTPLFGRSAGAAGGGDKVVIWSLDCEFAPVGTPWDQLDCQTFPNVGFQIETAEESLSTMTDLDGFAVWRGNTTYVSVSESIPAGYRVEVYCSLNEVLDGFDSLLWIADLADNGNGGATTELAAGMAQAVVCAFYNIELDYLGGAVVDFDDAVIADGIVAQDDQALVEFDDAAAIVDNNAMVPASVSIDVHSCPDDFFGTGFYQHLTACTSEKALYGVPLKLTAVNISGSYLYSQPDGFGGAAPMVWSNVEAGPITLTDIAQNTIRPAKVFCSLIPRDPGAAPLLDGTELPVVNGEISIILAAGDQLICDWHRFPGGVASQPNEDPDPHANDARIVISKRICADGPVDEMILTGDPVQDLDLYLAACESAQDGVKFTLTGAYEESSRDTVDGRVAWTELAAGDYTIAEEIPDGYGDPVVFCEGNVPGRQYIRPNIVQHDATGGYIAFSMEASEEVTCNWFNIYTGDADHGHDHDGDGRADRDGDGLYDDDETDVYGTDPERFDTDGGGVGDGDEVYFDTDPLDPNDDSSDGGGDGGEDGWDGQDGDGGAVNSDGDGLADEDEYSIFGTDPYRTDSDDDGLGDGEELYDVGTDPFNADTDGDMLVDGDEVYVIWTDPLSADTDGDGVGDGDESYYYGTDPLDPTSY